MATADEPEAMPLQFALMAGFFTVRLPHPTLVPPIGERRWYGGEEYRVRGSLNVGEDGGSVRILLLVTRMPSP